MLRRPVFGELVQQLTAHQSLRQVSRLTEISHTSIRDWRQGGIPRAEMLAQFAGRMGFTPEIRSQLFDAAGLVDPNGAQATFGRIGLTSETLPPDERRAYPEGWEVIFARLEGLPPEDVEMIKAVTLAVIQERRRTRGLPPP